MELRAYQLEALRTDRIPQSGEGDLATSLIVPMLGLAGETGQLLSEYKKHLRDGDAHRLFKDRVSEELGDLLWYIAAVASKFGLNLDTIASRNLSKAKERWGTPTGARPKFDEGLPELERLPRNIEVELNEVSMEGRPKVCLSWNGEVLGSPLGDNAYDPDGYRFHDIFHLSYAAILGWSPNLRAFLGRKRKSDPLLDDIEDGGRARVLEEAVSALVFDYARAHNFLAGVADIDYSLLRTIRSMTAHLEVSRCSACDWEHAILEGFHVWRQIVHANGGRVLVNLDERRIVYLGVPGEHRQTPPTKNKRQKTPLSANRNGTSHRHSTIMAQTNKPPRHAQGASSIQSSAVQGNLGSTRQ